MDAFYHRKYNDGSFDIIFYKDNKLNTHRESGPALISFNQLCIKIREVYFIDGMIHREDGPAKILYNDDGSIYCEQYFYRYKQFGSLKELQDYAKTRILM